MYDYDLIERIVMSVLQSSPDVFLLDGNVLKFKGDVIYNPNSNPGPKGDRGPQGESGEKGDKGEKGDVGPQGPKGDSIIISASKGDKGDKGDRGPQGINGKDGITPNITCTASVNGSSGTPSCTVTRTENSGSINFHFAFSGLKGAQGIQGIPGVNGKNGKDGIDGADASTSTIQTIINNVKDLVDDEIDRIEFHINDLNNEIQEKSRRMVSEIDWIKETFPSGSGSYSNFGLQDVKEYLQTIALWEESDNATKVKWSTIKLSVDRISAEVNQIKLSGIDYEALLGELYSYITGEETITTGMQSTWSRFLSLGENNILLLEWMASGIKTQANSKEAIAELFASAKNNNSEAYAGLETRVSNIEGSYVSSTSLSSMVENKVSTSISGILTENSSNTSVANLYARLRNAEEKIDNMGGISIETLTDRVSSTLFADAGSAGYAAVRTAVNNAMSSVTITADQIENIGLVIVNSINDIIGGSTTAIGAGYISVGKVYTGNVYAPSGSDLYLLADNNVVILCNVAEQSDEGRSFVVGQEDPSAQSSYIMDGDPFGSFDYVTLKAKKELKFHTSEEAITIGSHRIAIDAANVYCNSNPISSSDENLKNIKEYISPSIESIASVRLVNYELKSNIGYIKSGSIALDWKDILPYAVSSIDEELHLGLDYGSTALISAVTAAREIVKLKLENEQLKERISNLEDKINNFN